MKRRGFIGMLMAVGAACGIVKAAPAAEVKALVWRPNPNAGKGGRCAFCMKQLEINELVVPVDSPGVLAVVADVPGVTCEVRGKRRLLTCLGCAKGMKSGFRVVKIDHRAKTVTFEGAEFPMPGRVEYRRERR